MNNPFLRYSFATRADQIISFGANNLKELKKNGCLSVEIGIENGSDTALKRYNKKLSVKQNEEALNICKEAGLFVLADYIMFDELTTIEELFENIQFIKRNNLNNQYEALIFNYLRPYPGTLSYKRHIELFGEPFTDLYLDNTSSYFLNKNVEQVFIGTRIYADAFINQFRSILITVEECEISKKLSHVEAYLIRRQIAYIQNSFFEELVTCVKNSKMNNVDVVSLQSYLKTKEIINKYIKNLVIN